MIFSQQPNRIPPLGPASAYVSYEIRALPDTTVVAACKDVGCEYWRDGWDSPVDERTVEGRMQAYTIRRHSGRTFTELRRADGVTVFRFAPYQRCFREHRTKPDLWLKRDGDWRQNPTGRKRLHQRATDWVEDFQEHEGRLADLRQKG
jgi:hypothetical protein